MLLRQTQRLVVWHKKCVRLNQRNGIGSNAMLTSKQHDLLKFINDCLRQTGICPSFDEMKEGLGLRSKAGIYRLVSALEERGFLERRHNRARALAVLRLPENLVADGEPVGELKAASVALTVRMRFSPGGTVRCAPDETGGPLPEMDILDGDIVIIHRAMIGEVADPDGGGEWTGTGYLNRLGGRIIGSSR